MIMHIAITIIAMCLAISSLATATAEQDSLKQSAEVSETNIQQHNVVPAEAGIDMNAVAVRLINDYVTPTVCSYSSEFCAKNQLQSRGIQSYLATAGTLLAGVLGVIMTKISILIALSILSTVIGKMLLVYALFKSDPHHHLPHYKAAHYNAHPLVKYTKDKYYIKNTPSIHNHDLIVDSPSEYSSPYVYSPSVLESTVHDQKLKGVSYYKR
ncbi:uncharacterized protein LOC112601729 [Melanaphis sacchari]|uniref:uncharacterized protein LOC112601729 n=1 Tax=Melanaphis sacchari TaxID=742174 RepID=UPI000DC13930|nr:uncharacterized protein LOC112601729 [Melanaphis sacchari]